VTPSDRIQLLSNGQTHSDSNKGESGNKTQQEQNCGDNRGDSPHDKSKPKPARLRMIKESFVAPTTPMEEIHNRAAQNCNRQEYGQVHSHVNPPNNAGHGRAVAHPVDPRVLQSFRHYRSDPEASTENCECQDNAPSPPEGINLEMSLILAIPWKVGDKPFVVVLYGIDSHGNALLLASFIA